MFQFFEGISGFIATIVGYFVNLFMLLVELLVSIGKAVVWLFGCIVILPPFLTAFVVVPISLAIIFQILNKGS